MRGAISSTKGAILSILVHLKIKSIGKGLYNGYSIWHEKWQLMAQELTHLANYL
jgi:hypothetical protein